MSQSRELISIATISRAHGIQGAFRIHCNPVHVPYFKTLPVVSINGSDHRISKVGGTDAGPILTVEGITTRTESEALRGVTIEVDAVHLPEREDDEFLVAELDGCDVHDQAGVSIGTVTQVRLLPANDVLDVALHAGGEVLVPFIADAVPEVDIEARVIVVDRDFLGLDQ